MRDTLIRRSAVRSRLLTARLARSGALGRKGRYLGPNAPMTKPRYLRRRGAASMVGYGRKRKTTLQRPQKCEATGGSITRSASILKSYPSQQVVALKRVGAPNHYTTNVAQYFATAAGFQAQWSKQWLTNQELQNLRNVISTGQNGSYRFVIDDLSAEILLTNTTNVPLELEIWDLVLKKDLQSVLTYQTPTASIPVAGKPEEYWGVGSMVDANNTTPGPPYNSEILGATPYDTQLFRDYFKQVKKTIVHLPQGASHRHLVVRKMNRVIDDAFIRQSGILGHKGISSFTMFNLKGFPVGGLDETGAGYSTSSAGEIAMVTTYRYKYTWVSDISNFNVNVDNLTSPAETAQGFLNIGSGQLDTFKNVIT